MITLENFVNNINESKQKYFKFTEQELKLLQLDVDDMKKTFDKYSRDFKGKNYANVNEFKAEEGLRYIIEFNNPFYYGEWVTKDKTAKTHEIPGEGGEKTIFTIGVGDKFGRIMLPLLFEQNDSVYIQCGNDKFDSKKGWNITRKLAKGFYKVSYFWGKRGEGIWLYMKDDVKELPAVYNIPVCRREDYESKFAFKPNAGMLKVIALNDETSEAVKLAVNCQKEREEKAIKDKEAEELRKKKLEETQKYWKKIYSEYTNYGTLNSNPKLTQEQTDAMKDSSAWIEYDGPFRGDHTCVSHKYKAYYYYCSAD